MADLDPIPSVEDPPPRRGREAWRAHRRRRFRRHGRRAYIRSVYTLPSLATLGNAVCGFAAIYVASLASTAIGPTGLSIDRDPWTQWWAQHGYLAACYLIFLAMVFDALDGRLARFARHTTDFGGQLDSLADAVSFGAAPAFIALMSFKSDAPPDLPFMISRLVWAIGAIYFCCAAIRLARFNVSNEHGEQHHFSFLGLPSPGAAGAVVSLIMVQQDLGRFAAGSDSVLLDTLHHATLLLIPTAVLGNGLLMVSKIRYPHLVNRYLRGRKTVGQLVVMFVLLMLLVVAHRYTIAVATIAYSLWGIAGWVWAKGRARSGLLAPAHEASARDSGT